MCHLVDLVAPDVAGGSQPVITPAVAVAEAGASPVDVELEGAGVGVEVGGGIEVCAVDFEHGGELDVLAARVSGAVRVDSAAVGGVEVQLPGGSDGREEEGAEEGGGLHFWLG